MILVSASSNITHMWIFAGVPRAGGIKRPYTHILSKFYPTGGEQAVTVNNPIVVWRPLPTNPSEYPHVPYIARNSIGLQFAADSMGLFFKFFICAP